MIVTGSNGLIGSELVVFFTERNWQVTGIDNNMRADFFGPQGDTSWNLDRLKQKCPGFVHLPLDVRDQAAIFDAIVEVQPGAIVHAAAQPSHDLAAKRPFDDFDVNARGTLNLLEATRRYVPDAVFVYMSTNKVYGDRPNCLELVELETRWDFADARYQDGISEDMPVDQCMHSLFGVSKLAADLMVQEYGRYFGLKTCCLRGGCLTGAQHSGVELHGFLSYLVRCNVEGRCYNIYGYKGKQVRDNIHAYDVARFIEEFIAHPRSGEVYNIGGGRENSCSILEAFDMIQRISGKPMQYKYLEQNRMGDHICYISNLSKAKAHYPNWNITRNLWTIFEEIYAGWKSRLQEPVRE